MKQENQNASHQAWNRRVFLCATTATATGWLSFPRLLAAAFQEPTRRRRELPQPPPHTEYLLAAAVEAFEQKKPMLVVVVPRRTLDRDENRALGGFRWGLGQWITSSDTDYLLDLGLFVPAFGNAGDLQAAFQVEVDLPQPLLLWVDVLSIEGTRVIVNAVPIRGSIDDHDQFEERRRKRELPRPFERRYFAWLADQLAQMLRRALECRGEQVLEELAARTYSAMTRDVANRLGLWIREGHGLSDYELRRYTALLRTTWRGFDPDLIAARRPALAAAIHTDIRSGNIPGAAFGYMGSCGAVYKDEQSRRQARGPMGPCGTAHLPDDTREFLLLVSS